MLHTPEFESDSSLTEETIEHPKKRSLFFIVLLCIIFFFSGCLITRALFADKLSDDPTAYDPITLEPKKPQGFFKRIKNLVLPPRQVLQGQEDERINILLLGQGGPGHDGPYLTDTIIIASLNTKTKQVAFVSIPRDLLVNIPGIGYRKINNANSIGETKQKGLGPAFTANVIKNNFDIDIPYYALIDFKAFESIIDAIGGVDVTVDRAFTDATYPIPGKEDALPESNRYKILRFEKGEQHLDGETALEFTRSRHGNNGEGSDYARSKRQQKVIVAVKEKILSAGTLFNPVRINEIINSLSTHITTNLEFSDMIAFLKLSREFDTQHLVTLTLDDSPNGFLKSGVSSEGAFILQPKTGNFQSIQDAIDHIFEAPSSTPNLTVGATPNLPGVTSPTPSEDIPSLTQVKPRTMKIELKNGTWKEGLASRVKSELEEKNLFIFTIGNTTQRPKAKSGIYILTKSPSSDTVALLQSTLHIPVVTTPSGENAATSTDILVVLGDDYTE